MSTINPAGSPAISGIRPSVQAAIRDASNRTDTDFDYLLAQARIESALDPSAKARTSSAAGLYQFTNQTWLETLNRHGSEHGLDWAANAISTQGGRARITDPSLESAIMQLRYDPQSSSLMAAELAGDNGAFLENSFGRPADHTELYLAHFLGASGASKFIAAHEANPGQSAADLFPQAASANRGVFYSGGRERSLGEVRDLFAAKLERSGTDAGALAPSATGASRPTYGDPVFPDMNRPNMTQRSKPGAPQRPSMSDLLQTTFAPTREAASAQPTHVNRAYERIARFGL